MSVVPGGWRVPDSLVSVRGSRVSTAEFRRGEARRAWQGEVLAMDPVGKDSYPTGERAFSPPDSTHVADDFLLFPAAREEKSIVRGDRTAQPDGPAR